MNTNEPLNPIGDHCATLSVGSDSYPYKVVFRNEKRVEAQMVIARWNADKQDFEYFEHPNANTEVFTLRKNNLFVEQGCGYKTGRKLYLGRMRYYMDPSF